MTGLVVTSDLEHWFSTPRLSTYRATGLDPVDMYRWNAQLAAAVFEVINHTEVLIRNAFDKQLSAYSGTDFWFDDPRYGFNARTLSDITKAKNRATKPNTPLTAGAVLSEFTLGFWRWMVSANYNTTAWPRVRRSFTGLLRRDRDRLMIEPLVVKINETRNRVAHHETVFTLPTTALEDDMILLASWIDPDAAGWIKSVSRVGAVLADKPTR
jgi:hypothetical protein